MNSRYSNIIPVEEGQEWLKWLSKQLREIPQDPNKNIEIELKYATLIFHPNPMVTEDYFRRLSYQAVLWLNNSSSGVGSNYKACFPDSKKFYAMREFLENICRESDRRTINSNSEHTKHNEPKRDINFYQNLTRNCENSQLKLKEKELRIDVNHAKHRYSYSHDRGWSKMTKEKLTHYDLMYCNQTVRLTVASESNNEWVGNVCQELLKIFEAPAAPEGRERRNNNNAPCLRLKNIMKFEKKGYVEYSLSEVLVINDEEKWRKLMNMADLPETLNNYLVDEFANFYGWPGSPQTHRLEVECEVTQAGVTYLRELLDAKKGLEFEGFFDGMLQDFCSLFHADYCIKVEEMKVIAEKYKSQNGGQPPRVPGRLENEIGHYMRSELADFIQDHSK